MWRQDDRRSGSSYTRCTSGFAAPPRGQRAREIPPYAQGELCDIPLSAYEISGLYDPLAHSPHGRLSAIRHAHFPQDMLDMLLDRFIADAQRLGDFLIRQAER